MNKPQRLFYRLMNLFNRIPLVDPFNDSCKSSLQYHLSLVESAANGSRWAKQCIDRMIDDGEVRRSVVTYYRLYMSPSL